MSELEVVSGDADPFFTNNPFGERIFKLRYTYGDEDWSQACRRVANHIARGEEPEHFQRYSDEFYNELHAGRFMPGGRIWYGSGRNKAQLINCFVLPCDDSREGWGKMLSDTTVISGTGGGIGANFSRVRFRNAPIRGTGGLASGSVSVMYMVDGVGIVIMGGGGRRAAFMFCLNHDHPDVIEFLDAKLSTTKLPQRLIDVLLANGVDRGEIPEELLRGNLSCANISVVFMNESPADFFEKVKADADHDLVWQGKVVKTIKARELWDRVITNALKNGEPGVLNGHLANAMNNIHYYAQLESTNPCFAAGTSVLTAEGYSPIENLVGKTVTIWDGAEWRVVDNFRVTAENEPVYTLSLSNGQAVTATAYHSFILHDGTRKRLRELQVGDVLMEHDITVPGSIKVQGAYLKGFLTGDGTAQGTSAMLNLYEPKYGCVDRLLSSAAEIPVQSYSNNDNHVLGFCEPVNGRRWMQGLTCRRSDLHAWATEYKMRLPDEVLNWTDDDKHDFIAGCFDADGTVVDTDHAFGYQISSVNVEWLRGFQRLLLTVGVRSKLNLNKPAGLKDFGPERGGVYPVQALYRLSISQRDSIRLSERVTFSRLKSFKGRSTAYNSKPRPVSVTSVEFSHVADKVYCCTVAGSHAFSLTSGITTGQCGEIWMQPYSVCCLGAVVLPRFVKESKAKNVLDRIDWDALHQTVSTGIRFLDDVLSVTYYPISEVEKESKRTRRVGLGVMGLHDMLLNLGVKYTSEEALQIVDKVMAFIKHTAYDTSTYLAVEKGSFPEFNRDEFLKSGFVKTLKPSTRSKIKQYGMRNCAVLTIAPTGTTSLVQGVTGGIEPLFAPAYKRNYYDGGHLASEVLVHPLFESFVKGSQDVSHFEGADDVSPDQHFQMQVVCQKHVDNSISKTVNITQAKYTPELLSDLYMKYLPQLKGVTIYPEGSRDFTPLERIPNEDGVAHVLANTAQANLEDDCENGMCGL